MYAATPFGATTCLLLGLGRRLRHRNRELRRVARWRNGEELADQGELRLCALIGLVQRERAIIFAAGETGVDIAQVLVRDRVVGVRRQGGLERRPGLIVVTLLREDDGEVVVRLRQLRIVLGQPLERRE